MKGAPQAVTQRKILGLAELLGGTPRTVLIRCPCGRRNYFDRAAWQWLEVAFCVRCWQAIIYHDLRVISRWEGERMLKEHTVYEGELKALRTLEGLMRLILEGFDVETLWKLPVPMQRRAHAARGVLQLAERARARQGTEPTVPLEDLPQFLREFLQMPGEDDSELTTEHTRLLALFSRLPEERRDELLASLRQEVVDDSDETEDIEL
jgi:hypothetical protein